MKRKILLLGCMSMIAAMNAQVFTTNRSAVGMEHNLLFHADTQFHVEQTQGSPIKLASMFDGKMVPSYTPEGISEGEPVVILIDSLPAKHIQAGAWVGWTTRYWEAKKFKIEGYNSFVSEKWGGTEGWKTFADYSSVEYTGGGSFVKNIQEFQGAYTKLRFTFYSSDDVDDGRLGLSELFFLHPEAVSPYQGLINQSSILNKSHWEERGNDLFYLDGDIGIGTATPDAKLSVNGTLHCKEVKVDLENWADFVFDADYELPTLRAVENHIKKKGHLSGIPSSKEIQKNGVLLGGMNAKLLQKIEELTLYAIAQGKKIQEQEEQHIDAEKKRKDLHKRLLVLEKSSEK